MEDQHDERLRLIAQSALLGYVTPELRSVSLDISPERRMVQIRFYFHDEPVETYRDAASCAATGIMAGYTGDWTFDEQYINRPAPGAMDHLRLLVYHRCEDEHTTPGS